MLQCNKIYQEFFNSKLHVEIENSEKVVIMGLLSRIISYTTSPRIIEGPREVVDETIETVTRLEILANDNKIHRIDFYAHVEWELINQRVLYNSEVSVSPKFASPVRNSKQKKTMTQDLMSIKDSLPNYRATRNLNSI